jgi:hypothetical protein
VLDFNHTSFNAHRLGTNPQKEIASQHVKPRGIESYLDATAAASSTQKMWIRLCASAVKQSKHMIYIVIFDCLKKQQSFQNHARTIDAALHKYNKIYFKQGITAFS